MTTYPPCRTCDGTGTVNVFEPGPTCRGEHGDMEYWPGPCPECASTLFQVHLRLPHTTGLIPLVCPGGLAPGYVRAKDHDDALKRANVYLGAPQQRDVFPQPFTGNRLVRVTRVSDLSFVTYRSGGEGVVKRCGEGGQTDEGSWETVTLAAVLGDNPQSFTTGSHTTIVPER